MRTFVLSEKISSLSGYSWLGFMAYFSLAHPLLEEMYWRGGPLSQKRFVSARDLAFGGYHLLVLIFLAKFFWCIAVSGILVVVGWAWRRHVLKCNSLTVPILSHVLANFSIIIAVNALL